MSAVAKGTRNEKRCEDALKADGYETWRVRRTKFGNMDAFGLFDIIGWQRRSKRMRFIQVKSNRVDRKTLNEMSKAQWDMPDHCSAEVWVWIDRRGWRKY